jgi:hypothetical protein
MSAEQFNAVLARLERVADRLANRRPIGGELRTPGSMDEWKKFRHVNPEKRVFQVLGGYPDLRRAMLARGWVENANPDSCYWDFKWSLNAQDIDQRNLKTGQIVNHFVGNREMTTKVGLTTNLRESSWRCGIDGNEYYPMAFCISDNLEKDDFLAEYKLCQAQAVLKRFIQHVDSPTPSTDLTFGESVLYAAVGVCERLSKELDEDVLDNHHIADCFCGVKDDE